MLAAFDRWGVEASLERFNGMFAFALWDRQGRTLHLARDRFGEKPLYYGWVGDTFLFGSELKALKAHPGMARRNRPRRAGAVHAAQLHSGAVFDLPGDIQAASRPCA